MAFSYSLVLALLLLFPGICAWAGIRVGMETELVSPRPDVPNSTTTLFIIVLGTLVGHTLGACVFGLQQAFCSTFGHCIPSTFDPNIYKVPFDYVKAAGPVPDGAIPIWLASLLAIGLGNAKLFQWLSSKEAYRANFDVATFGWLNPLVQRVKRGNAVIVAYVVTKTEYQGASIAFEGVVQRLGMDDDQNITMVALLKVDRFLVKITDDEIKRIDTPSRPIQQLQLRAAEIANIALEVVVDPDVKASR